MPVRSVALRRLFLLLLLAAPGLSLGQDAADPTPDTSEGASEEVVEDPPRGVAAFGVTAGFPAYRTMAASVSLQQQFAGLALRGGWTPWAGPFAGASLRAYPPLPVPAPTYLAAGANASRAGVAPFAAAGAHVPVSRNWRVDLEAGAAWTPLLDERQVAPYLTVGVSFATSVEIREAPEYGDGATTGIGASAPAPACEVEGPPEPAGLSGAVARTVSAFLEDARATYGSVYTGLRYDYELASTDLSGRDASVRVDYEGSVQPIAGGARQSASGMATVDFQWNGCGWRRTGLSY